MSEKKKRLTGVLKKDKPGETLVAEKKQRPRPWPPPPPSSRPQASSPEKPRPAAGTGPKKPPKED